MSYDYNAQAWDSSGCGTTQFNSPLDRPDNVTNPCEALAGLNVSAAVDALISAQVPAASIGIGVPAYGRAYAIDRVSDWSAYVGYNNTNINQVHNIAVPTFGDVWTNRQILTGRAYGVYSNVTENTTWTIRESVSGVNQTVACLLYTSPSPRDLSTSRMPSSA